jgi:Bromodomain
MLEAQRNFILSRIEQVAMSKTIYPPIGQLKDDSNSLTAYNSFGSSITSAAGSNGGGGSTTSVAALVAASANGGGGSAATAGSRGNQSAARAMAVPGMEQAGWTMSDLMAAMGQGKESDRQKTALKTEFLAMIRKIEEQHFAWPFREPVDTNEVPDYLDVIKEPIDLSTIDKRIRQDNHYKSKQMLYQDLMLMVNNCKLYNEPASPYAQCASSLEAYLGQLFRKEDIAGRG